MLENPGGLRTPLICGKYVVPFGASDGTPGERLLVGATFEYDAPERLHREACAEEAEAALRPSIVAMHPALARARVLGAQAGVRALPPRSHHGYVPIAGRLPIGRQRWGRGMVGATDAAATDGLYPRCGTWLFGGLGSRGLIHHALLGSAVADAVLNCDEARLPEHTRRCQQALTEACSDANSSTGT